MRIVVVGTGAQAKYALETFRLRNFDVWGVMPLEGGAEAPWIATYGHKVVSFDADFEEASAAGVTHFIICHANPDTKEKLVEGALARGLSPVDSVHPGAFVATTANLGRGVIVNAGAVIQPLASVGEFSMIHAGVIVEHDVKLGRFVNLAPGVRLAGWVRVGDKATVYTGANIIPSISIGERAVVAAGATVIKDVMPGSLVAGVPAAVKRSDLI